MKVLRSAFKWSLFSLLMLIVGGMLACMHIGSDERVQTEVVDAADEDTCTGVEFTYYVSDGELRTEQYYPVWESVHSVAYLQAHALTEDEAKELLECFEEKVFPMLPAPALEDQKLAVLLSYMEGHIYGYTLFPMPEQGPAVCLNALYPNALSYTLAHEYQHLCAYNACAAGKTVLSEDMDELLSDIFCESLYPDQGYELGILSEARAMAARDKIKAWGSDALPHVYNLLRAGYPEEEVLSIMENQ